MDKLIAKKGEFELWMGKSRRGFRLFTNKRPADDQKLWSVVSAYNSDDQHLDVLLEQLRNDGYTVWPPIEPTNLINAPVTSEKW